MRLRQIAKPVQPPIGLEEVRAQLRLTGTDEDALLDGLVATALAKLDGPNGLLGRCLVTQTWEAALDAFPSRICLPLPPCQAVLSITYRDEADAVQTLPPEAYRAASLGDESGAVIGPAGTWPQVRCGPEAVCIRFTAGYGDDPSDIPAPIRTAMLMHVAHLFEHREAVTEIGFTRTLPMGWSDLVFDYRVAGC